MMSNIHFADRLISGQTVGLSATRKFPPMIFLCISSSFGIYLVKSSKSLD